MKVKVRIQRPHFFGPQLKYRAKGCSLAAEATSHPFLDTLADCGGPESIAALRDQKVWKSDSRFEDAPTPRDQDLFPIDAQYEMGVPKSIALIRDQLAGKSASRVAAELPGPPSFPNSQHRHLLSLSSPAESRRPESATTPKDQREFASRVAEPPCPPAPPNPSHQDPPSPGRLLRALSWLQKRYSQRTTKQLRVAETVSLGEKRFVAILDVEGRKYLIGGGAGNVCLLTQLDGASTSAEPELPVMRLHGVH